MFIIYHTAVLYSRQEYASNSGDPATITITCDLLVHENHEMSDLILEDEE